jgi:hypothetical protein
LGCPGFDMHLIFSLFLLVCTNCLKANKTFKKKFKTAAHGHSTPKNVQGKLEYQKNSSKCRDLSIFQLNVSKNVIKFTLKCEIKLTKTDKILSSKN